LGGDGRVRKARELAAEARVRRRSPRTNCARAHAVELVREGVAANFNRARHALLLMPILP